MAREDFEVSPAAAAALTRALHAGRRIVAVGTTTTRTPNGRTSAASVSAATRYGLQDMSTARFSTHCRFIGALSIAERLLSPQATRIGAHEKSASCPREMSPW